MLPQRKHTRLKYYDYSRNGMYFITICTKDKKTILGKIISNDDNNNIVGRDAHIPPNQMIIIRIVKGPAG